MQWTCTWAHFGRWWGTGKPACFSPWGHKELEMTGRLNNINTVRKSCEWRVGWWAMELGCPDMLLLQALKILGEGLSFRQCQCLFWGIGTWNMDEDWERSWLAWWMLVNWSRAGWGELFIDGLQVLGIDYSKSPYTNEFHLRVRSWVQFVCKSNKVILGTQLTQLAI